MKRIVVLGMVAMGYVALAQAQVKTGDGQFIVYKWYEKGIANYSKVPPRGVQNYVKLNEYGLVISERPDFDAVIPKPARPQTEENTTAGAATPAGNAASQTADKAKEVPPGTITREKRCENALKALEVINTKKTVYEDDGAGNLVPLDSAGIMNRKTQAQQEVDQFCSPQ